MTFQPPGRDCPLCPRLVQFRQENRDKYPSFFNGPVPSFGAIDASFLVVGLAPGLKGANQSGRPFTGDYAGLILYSALKKCGFAEGEYDPEKVIAAEKKSPAPANHHADGFYLNNCRITNGVRCVPQENKPEPSEIKQCNNFLKTEIAAMPNLKVILSLGLVSHKAVLMALGQKQSAYKFAHAAQHQVAGLTLLNSYHTSRYNINVGTLTQAMFDDVIGQVRNLI